MWRPAVADAALESSVAVAPNNSPPALGSTDLAVPQHSAISAWGRNPKGADESLARDNLTRFLALGGNGADCGDVEGDDTPGILEAAEEQLKLLTIPPAVSGCLKSEERQKVVQAQQRLQSEVAAITRDKMERNIQIEKFNKALDERVRAALQEDIKRLQEAIEDRKKILEHMGYVKHQKIRELLTMAEFWGQGNEICPAASAALVASWRVTQPLEPVSSIVTSDEKSAVGKFVKILVNKGNAFSSGLESGAPPPAPFVASAKALLETARTVVHMLRAAGIKKKHKKLEDMCSRLSSDLEAAPAAPPRGGRAPSMSSIASASLRFRTPLRRSWRGSSLRDPSRRHTLDVQPLRLSETASRVEGARSQTPPLATSSPLAPAPDPAPTGHPELEKLEKWTNEAHERLRGADIEKMTSEEVASSQDLVLEGMYQFEKVQSISTEPASDDDTFKKEVLKSSEYLLREFSLFLCPRWIQQLSESKRRLEEARTNLKEALMDCSPDSAPPPGSSVLENMMHLRASIVNCTDIVARLKPFHETRHSFLHLLSMIAGELTDVALAANDDIQRAGALFARGWTTKLSVLIPPAEPPPVTPRSDLGFLMQTESVTTQAASILEVLLKAGCESPEVQDLEAAVKAAEAAKATGAS
ncbi:hypothetical protein Esti_004474 [Eimeria stiedai]